MALKVLSEASIPELAQRLMREMRVVGPTIKERDFVHFAELQDPSQLELAYTSTAIPPKQFLLPPREDILSFEVGGQLHVEPIVEGEPTALVGVHPCDIYAIGCQDLVYRENGADPNYFERRNQVRIIGVDCLPDEWCFCASMGTARVDEGYDLFLTSVDGEYICEVGTDWGAWLLKEVPGRPAQGKDLVALKAHMDQKISTQSRRIECDVSKLPLYFTAFEEAETWETTAERCYSCGTCNLVCPTCVCFDVQDEVEMDLSSGKRRRVWDGCMLRDFAAVAGGENFRDEPSERLRHRFYRKYAYLFTKFGLPFCCGCGRCVRQCLVDIDPVEVINALLAETKKGAYANV